MPMAAPRGRIAPDYSRSSVSRYIQLSTLFRSRIESGEWAQGQRLPTVDELAVECEVARETVRQALHVLANEGLIERFRAKGTFVKAVANERLWCEVGTDFSGLLLSQPGAKIELLEERARVKLSLRRDDVGHVMPEYRHLRRRHWRHQQAYLLADVFIGERLVDRIPRAAFKTKTALKLIADVPNARIADVRQTLTVASADMEAAGMLDIPLNAPVAFIDRHVVDEQGDLVLFARGIYRGDVVRLDLRMSARQHKE